MLSDEGLSVSSPDLVNPPAWSPAAEGHTGKFLQIAFQIKTSANKTIDVN